jgi:predicted nucleic acid-binding protein
MGTVVIDSGVMIAILDAADIHHAAARSAVVELGRSADLVLPASAYSELMVHPHADGPDEVAHAEAFIEALPARIEPIDRAVALAAAQLRARFGRALRLPDALVLGTAIALRADLVLTTDSRWPETGVATRVVKAG